MFNAVASAVPTFQTYLIPTLPFRRRQPSSIDTNADPRVSRRCSSNSSSSDSSTASTASTAATSLSDVEFEPASPQQRWTGKGKHKETAQPRKETRNCQSRFLSGHTSHISCGRCHTNLALTSQIISKGFTGRHGRAFLVSGTPTEFFTSAECFDSSVPVSSRQKPTRSQSVSVTPSLSMASGAKECNCVARCGDKSNIPGLWSTTKEINKYNVSSSSSSSSSSAHPVPSNTCPTHSKTVRSNSIPTATTTSRRASTMTPPSLLPNTHSHKAVPRHLVTGMHTVSDIACAVCGSVLGWKYVAAEDEAQRYKVGKFILETRRVVVGSFWEHSKRDTDELSDDYEGFASEDEEMSNSPRTNIKSGVNEAVEFDSQDEDECDDLFAGVWSPALAKRRRARRNVGK